MPSQPLVSVVIPTFNRKTMLSEAVQSVLHQTYRPLELIVVDDGSSDSTAELLRARTNLIFLQTSPTGPRGVSAARNVGIRRAQGRFLAFLDSDDLWEKRKIERQVAHMIERTDLLISQTEEIWIRRGRRVNPKKIHQKYGGDIFNHCLPRCVVSPSAVMMRKEFFDLVGLFDESFPACEDYELWLRAAARFPIGLLDEPLTVKRGGHDDQLSAQHSLDRYRIHALVKLLTHSTLNEAQTKLAKEELHAKCRIYIQGCLKHEKYEEVNEITARVASILKTEAATELAPSHA